MSELKLICQFCGKFFEKEYGSKKKFCCIKCQRASKAKRNYEKYKESRIMYSKRNLKFKTFIKNKLKSRYPEIYKNFAKEFGIKERKVLKNEV
jgi:hypothetical protein